MNTIKKLVYNYGVPLVGSLCRSRNKYVNVIYYHDIVADGGFSFMQTNLAKFEKQMRYLAEHGYKTLRFDELDNSSVEYNSKSLIIAFDDGWKSNYTMIFDFMLSLGIKYNIYLAVGKIDNNSDYLTWDEVRMMHNNGLVGFGVHTYNHVDARDITKINPIVEFEEADKVFERELGYKPKDFCYPYGYYSEDSNRYLIENTDYSRIYTSRMMYSYMQDGRIIFGRTGISNDDIFSAYKAKVKGHYNVWSSIIR